MDNFTLVKFTLINVMLTPDNCTLGNLILTLDDCTLVKFTLGNLILILIGYQFTPGNPI